MEIALTPTPETTPRGSWEKLPLPGLTDARGELVAIEGGRQVPFEVKRVYYILHTQPEAKRGFHAHRTLDQVLIPLAGHCRVRVDDGSRQEEFLLDNPHEGLRIQNLVWREMFDASPDCILLVLAGDVYREEDYIRNYDDFLEATGY